MGQYNFMGQNETFFFKYGIYGTSGTPVVVNLLQFKIVAIVTFLQWSITISGTMLNLRQRSTMAAANSKIHLDRDSLVSSAS